MASDPQPKPVPPGGAGDPQQKHYSGMLVMSIVLSLAGFLILPILGPVTGLLLGFLGRRRVRANPQLIGPRLATWSIAIAVLAIAAQGFLIYRSYPGIAYTQAVSQKAAIFFEHVRKREFDEAFEEMSPAWQKDHEVKDIEEEVAAAFPGDAKIEIPKEQIEFQEDFSIEDFEKRIMDWLGGDYPAEISYVLPVVLNGEKGRRVGLDLSIETRRVGYGDFEVDLTDFDLKVLATGEEDASGTGGTEEGAEDGAAAGEKPEAGAATEEKGAAKDRSAEEGADAKTTEDEEQEDPR